MKIILKESVMANSIKVRLGNESFDKKGDVEIRIRALIKKYKLMEFIGGTDKELCLNLFQYHPRYAEKIGAGIEAIQVRVDEYGKRHFHLHRIDGSDDDISWPKCLASIK